MSKIFYVTWTKPQADKKKLNELIKKLIYCEIKLNQNTLSCIISKITWKVLNIFSGIITNMINVLNLLNAYLKNTS